MSTIYGSRDPVPLPNNLVCDAVTPETINRLGRYDFPDPQVIDPQGLGVVAMGGDLEAETLICAYAHGLFPWFHSDEPIAWWCPEPRCVMIPSDYVPSKSLGKLAKRARWQLTVDQAFAEVMTACSLPRYTQDHTGDHTWIHEEMIKAYTRLHQLGFAHSVEVWDEHQQLIGGLYGLKIGSIYFGESMFHKASNASKIAYWGLMHLCLQSGVELVDCQLPNDHLLSLGATTHTRAEFLQQVTRLSATPAALWYPHAYQPLSAAMLASDAPWQRQS